MPGEWQLATTYLGLVPSDADPSLPADTAWHPVDRLPATAFDHGAIVLAGRDRLRAKLSYTNAGFALAPETFTISQLRDLYAAALGHEVSATNLQRVLVRRLIQVRRLCRQRLVAAGDVKLQVAVEDRDRVRTIPRRNAVLVHQHQRRAVRIRRIRVHLQVVAVLLHTVPLAQAPRLVPVLVMAEERHPDSLVALDAGDVPAALELDEVERCLG